MILSSTALTIFIVLLAVPLLVIGASGLYDLRRRNRPLPCPVSNRTAPHRNARPRSPDIEQDEYNRLRDRLRCLVLGDEGAVERLVARERQRRPDALPVKWIEGAINQLMKDRRN